MTGDETTEETAKRVNLPLFYASSFQTIWTSNDLSLMFNANNAVMLPDGGLAAAPSPVALLSMSPQSAKDLLFVLRDGIEAYEEMYGEIKTDFVTRRDQSSGPENDTGE